MNPEIKQQLYGGEISDYFKNKDLKTNSQDGDNIASIYDYYVKNKKSLLDLLRLDPRKNFYDELK